MSDHDKLIKDLNKGDLKSLARAITIVENELAGHDNILQSLKINRKIPVIGFTGSPGTGKSTLINALISFLSKRGKKIAVIAVDPTSPFNFGSLLGDRLRMSEHFGNKNVFIRSLATRGSLGGLSVKTIEISDVMRAAPFDYVFIETVGVGQSEVEIAGLADTTVLVLAPGFGDEVQTIKSGIMEIADVFAVNKSDLAGTEGLVSALRNLFDHKKSETNFTYENKHLEWVPPIIKVTATRDEGISLLMKKIDQHHEYKDQNKKLILLRDKVLRLISAQRLKGLDQDALTSALKAEMDKEAFNLYQFASGYYS